MPYINHLPSLTTWEEAKTHWEKVKPIRGRGIDTRPLGRRSGNDMLIARTNGAEGWEYSAQLYGSNCVVFKINGIIHLTCDTFSPSNTTAQFMARVIGARSQVLGNRLRVDGFVVDNKTGIDIRRIQTNDPNMLAAIPESRVLNGWGVLNGWVKFEVLNPMIEYTRVLDRQNFKVVKLQYAKFINWLDGMLKAKEYMFSWDEVTAGLPQGMQDMQQRAIKSDWITKTMSLAGSDDIADYYPAACMLAYSNGATRRDIWRGALHKWRVDRFVFTQLLIKVYADKVLTPKEVPLKTYKRDAYKGLITVGG